jgi:Peptidase family M28/PDZ domain/PA domain
LKTLCDALRWSRLGKRSSELCSPEPGAVRSAGWQPALLSGEVFDRVPQLLVLGCVLVGALRLAWGAGATIDPNTYLNDIKYLASKELKGRLTGSPELEKAAAFIAGEFRDFGLQPVHGTSYYQPFEAVTGAHPGPGNRLRVGATALRFPQDFTPLYFSSSGRVSAGAVFAGYGITADDLHYDDYAGLDVKGRLVLILRHEPQEADEHSVFDGKKLTRHALFSSKASNAKMHGAAGVILINDTPNHAGEADNLPKFAGEDDPEDAGILFVQVKVAAVAPWFAAAGKDLDQLSAAIDKDLKPQSFTFPASLQADLQVDVQREKKTVNNVEGYLPGTTNEYVVIGAHYDHLGVGGAHSLAPSMTGTIHPGADDNASGVAGVIELARWFSRQPKQKRGILFLTFAGEEEGLLGSAYYVEHPDLPLDRAVAMINMDMIGRVREGKLYVGGSDSGTTLRALMDRLTPASGLKVDYSDNSGYGSSDHTSFTIGKVPVLFFFSGLHGDYHKPSDTWEKIDTADAVKVLQLVAEVSEGLREADGRPQFVRVAPPAHGGGDAGPVSSSSGGGYGPSFGSVPDFGEGVKGVKFADVRDGTPAAKAGLKAGDILVEFDGKAIENLYDFTYALRAKNPGDTVKVKVLRDGKPLEVSVLLTKRE